MGPRGRHFSLVHDASIFLPYTIARNCNLIYEPRWYFPLCKAFHWFYIYRGYWGIKRRERNIGCDLPLRKASCPRNATPNAKSLSHKNMVISANQVYPYETACVSLSLESKINVICVENNFFSECEPRRRLTGHIHCSACLSVQELLPLLPQPTTRHLPMHWSDVRDNYFFKKKNFFQFPGSQRGFS